MELMWIIIAVVVVLVVVVIAIYNGLVQTRVRVEEAWSDITVQLKRRLDLIPNLVNSVKGYATHEKEVFEKVTEARANALNAQGVAATAKAEGEFEQALKSLFAVAENYPQLRATENFQQLQAELTDTEDKIMASRRFYNGAARELNIKIDQFPSNVVAGMFGFKKREFFEVADQAAVEQPVDVKF
ncbi:MAG TPA: LemA family protein [Candidatus Saccharimonadales bacterium]|nr:LemA family protein [Candidatus Saccharimonadales bacterium]